MNPNSLEDLAQELTKKTGAPIEVNRAGLMLMASAMGKAVGMTDEQVKQGRDAAQRILNAYYKTK